MEAPAIEVVANSGRPARAATATCRCTRAACKRRRRRLSCGALAPQANGDGDMRVGNCREDDSERQRQQFVAPPGVRGPRPRGGHAHGSEKMRDETSRANAQRCRYVLGGHFYRQLFVSDRKKASSRQNPRLMGGTEEMCVCVDGRGR